MAEVYPQQNETEKGTKSDKRERTVGPASHTGGQGAHTSINRAENTQQTHSPNHARCLGKMHQPEILKQRKSAGPEL
jgi:hypothetical protein